MDGRLEESARLKEGRLIYARFTVSLVLAFDFPSSNINSGGIQKRAI
jgi:hypothetical protein